MKHLQNPRPFKTREKKTIIVVGLLLWLGLCCFSFLSAQNGRQEWKQERNTSHKNSWAAPQEATIVESSIVENNYWGPTYSVTLELDDGTVLAPRAIDGDDMVTGDDLLFWDCTPTGKWPPCNQGEGKLTSATSQVKPWDDWTASYNVGDVMMFMIGDLWLWFGSIWIPVIAGVYWGLRKNLAREWQKEHLEELEFIRD